MPSRSQLFAYRCLIRMFPRRFRAEHEARLRQLFIDMTADRRLNGRRLGPVFWLSLVWDAVTGAAAEWLAALRPDPAAGARRGGDLMSSFVTTVRQAVRQLARQPLYSGTVVLLVALGIAGNAAVFRLFDGLFLRPLPFEEPAQLVDLDVTAPQWNLEFVNLSITDFNDWREENRSFAGMTAYTIGGGNLVSDGSAVRIQALTATHDIDDVLRLVPASGRFFTEEEDHPDAPAVAMLSPGFIERQFGADAEVLGRTIQINGQSREVIGVLPDAARFLGEADVWMPLREDDQSSFYLRGIGRLNPGVTPAQAREELALIHARHVPERSVNEITSPTVMTVRDRYMGPQRLGGVVLLGAVAIVLLIACGNIAGLMMARSVARTEELALRAALGASRMAIVRQLLVESVLLAVAGSAAGVALGVWGSDALVGMLASQFPPFVTFGLDMRFLLFVSAVTMAAAVVSGLGPALRASRPASDLAGVTRSTSSRAIRRGLSTLVAAEVALATVLLVLSGLAVADIMSVGHVEPGYRVEGVTTYRVAPLPDRYPEPEDRLTFWQEYHEALEALPGVERATLSTVMPMMGHSGWFFDVDGDPQNEEDAEDSVVVLRRWVTPGFFDAMGMTMAAGRAFDEFDGRGDDSHVAVVNESFVRTHIPAGLDPIGQRIRTDPSAPWETIVGVTPDVKDYGLDQDSRPSVYEPVRQRPALSAHVALVSSGDHAVMMAEARRVTAAIDPELPIYDVMSLSERIDRGLLARRASSWLIALFSAVALVLAVAGLYGVISYGVGQRAPEIGIRLALGAQRSEVQRLILRQGLLIVGLGLGFGVGVAMLASRGVSSLLVSPGAPTASIIAGVAGVVLTIALAANYVPARRAGRLNPISLLRRD